jgi:uncharacterized protein YgiM (DUF1202 family)
MIASQQGANRWVQQIVMTMLLLVPFSPAQAQWFGSDWFAEKEPLQVSVDEAFINVYSGPGRGYPIFYVVERDEIITLLKSRTEWIRIKTRRGLVGWIKRDDMQFTLALDGSKPEFPDSCRGRQLDPECGLSLH